MSRAQQQHETFDYWQSNRDLVWRGVQAMFMCNGLFTSGRTLEQVFAQELAYIPKPIGTASDGAYVVDRERRAVAVGAADGTPVMRAAFREGIGCVSLAPDQTFEDIDGLPVNDLPPLPGDPATRRRYPGRTAICCHPLRCLRTSIARGSRRPRIGPSIANPPSRSR